MFLDRDAIRRRAKRVLSAFTVVSFLSDTFTYMFFVMLANVWILSLGSGSQNPTELLLIRLAMKDFISLLPKSLALSNRVDMSFGIITPLDRFESGAASLTWSCPSRRNVVAYQQWLVGALPSYPPSQP